MPHRQPKRGRLWLNDSSCVRLRPEYPNHVWSYDFVEDRTHNGRKIRMLNVIDEFTRECIAIRVERKLKAVDVIDVLSDLFILRGVPTHIRSDNVLCGQANRKQATVSRSLCLASPKRTGINASGGQQAKHALTFQPDHPMGAGQPDERRKRSTLPARRQSLICRISGLSAHPASDGASIAFRKASASCRRV